MDMDWLNGLTNNDLGYGEESDDSLYCPYTNGSDCALFTRGLQPQELCEALECAQMKLFQKVNPHRHRRNKAA
ncbi:MAG: hypothetical protein M1133_06445 [Armatimonadetes bacterium]|nr:hypothetical protein [Armatimonadota bacterium]